MKLRVYLLILWTGILAMEETQAQSELNLGLELRSRFQFRNGYRQMKEEGDNPTAVTFQRNRLTMDYQYKNLLKTHLSVQDIRVWGAQGPFDDTPNVGLFQAWGELTIAPSWKVKIGRQELVYDDGYILARRNWREGGLAHDAVLIKYKDSTFQTHAGLVLNQNAATVFQTVYQSANYKTMQFLWLKKQFGESDARILLLNRGIQKADTSVNYSQTLSATLNLKGGQLQARAIGLYQLGTDTLERNVNAYFWSGKLTYLPSEKLQFSVQADVLSGATQRDLNDPDLDENTAFDPHFSYRHSLFGHMDYFYVGFNPPSGLGDYMLKARWMPTKKVSIEVTEHFFYSEAVLQDVSDLAQDINAYLGTELDIVLRYQIDKAIQIQGGYAHMFASDSMESVLGRGDKDKLQNWVWLEMRFSPNLGKISMGK